MFMAIQQAACAALTGSAQGPDQAIETYRKRRDRMVKGLRRLGFRVEKPVGTFYLWVPIPGRTTSLAFAKRLLEEAHIVVTPGEGFGQYGQGYIRMALTVPEDRIEEGLRRLERLTF
jgi:aspartate/methionine/tyrosine aminotransferase